MAASGPFADEEAVSEFCDQLEPAPKSCIVHPLMCLQLCVFKYIGVGKHVSMFWSSSAPQFD
eukprot:CAMPEP_0175865402 /NCGR_PEP_ID=MMETSP0107_2-20121207/33630_1 /TAXON_ID=195067 ORGANISM="Goniomonas pacifica, Strain CCMP1869" /NCGR_SAMPLE_ID=MMETSP0107_2 /ASSEMBLY_ACC=CAM_ASM_000203 /LENGTH=61 /DNA_ID=CAMNT_0017182807 /DNA_START=46 /DNA_END=228 /DNA_ORIENTATION=+